MKPIGELILTQAEIDTIPEIREEDMQIGDIVASTVLRGYVRIVSRDEHFTYCVKTHDLYRNPIPVAKQKPVHLYISARCAKTYAAVMHAKLQALLANFQ
jgi:hypothetical protein